MNYLYRFYFFCWFYYLIYLINIYVCMVIIGSGKKFFISMESVGDYYY